MNSIQLCIYNKGGFNEGYLKTKRSFSGQDR